MSPSGHSPPGATAAPPRSAHSTAALLFNEHVQHHGSSHGELRWQAFPPPGYTEDHDDAEPPVEGTRIRLMGEYGVTMPLWDEGGPLPNDPEYLHRELGISAALSRDLAVWGEAWDSDADPTEHAAERRRLLARLKAEISPRFTID